ncbi:hypothetical protein [Azospirillum sp. ST 5-10]|uniref:hypothetical protein n=1 Tax=unclassified Azospirillum TaxID=2630922 RepID=UPI003F4A5082
MGVTFDRDQLLAAFDALGAAAVDAGGASRTLWSPAEFRNHNIFTEEWPLRRARTPVGRPA